MIAHQNVIEGNLYLLLKKLAPEAIGQDYLVMGTTETDFWKAGLDHPHMPAEALDNLHDFKKTLNFKMVGGWLPDESAPQPPSGSVDTIKDAQKLVAKI